jgi:hypothetical protein
MMEEALLNCKPRPPGEAAGLPCRIAGPELEWLYFQVVSKVDLR